MQLQLLCSMSDVHPVFNKSPTEQPQGKRRSDRVTALKDAHTVGKRQHFFVLTQVEVQMRVLKKRA